jgi:hypothetical protein
MGLPEKYAAPSEGLVFLPEADVQSPSEMWQKQPLACSWKRDILDLFIQVQVVTYFGRSYGSHLAPRPSTRRVSLFRQVAESGANSLPERVYECGCTLLKPGERLGPVL